MSKIRIHLRPYREQDKETLDAFRRAYATADLEVPHGFKAEGLALETVVGEKGNLVIGSLTGTLSVTLDPLVVNPEASALEIIEFLRLAEQALSVMARKTGAVDAYIAVPEGDVHYHDVLKRYGFEPTVQKCVVFRRPLVPDTETLVGSERDTAEEVALKL